MVGEVCSSASLGALGVVNKYQIPLVSPASTAPALSIKGDYFFRRAPCMRRRLWGPPRIFVGQTVPSDKYQGQFAARRMIALGAKTVVIASSSDSYGQELAYNFIAAFTRDGGKAFNVEVPAQAPNKNASDIVDAVRARSANGVFIATNDLAWGADIIKALRTAQPPLSAVTIFGGDSLMDATVPLRIGAALAKGVRGSDVTFGSPAFVAAFKTYTAGKNISYVPKASHAYDAAEALIEAYRRAEAPKDGKAILAQLADVRFKGVSGPIAFNEFGDLKYDPKGPRLYTVTEFGADGSIAVVRGE
ncbi:hypothetical protein MNEG_3430 [Monoraphidium neglectum]|uniref:Receptor ligand binding region domain-containing protein n=1 Tax=Monoraphidium neglectum TaxID=145388 RepID=A0A0D2NHQ7_9CHLO|nr:hypothetical protein MNEG_3430 [Monoraphidium neglectum]KIZ04521.1 hypothetical protein MNEG_3430 [Monoraphidium neglectum]|eukprot:XP_013903540.1 hypothetical protein MNEG_3430 [Monoraphidium neglectum]